MVVVLLIGIWNVGHILHIGELAVRSARVPKRTTLGLNLSLGIDFFVPALHGVFVGVPDNEVVDYTRITLPENLNAVETYAVRNIGFKGERGTYQASEDTRCR